MLDPTGRKARPMRKNKHKHKAESNTPPQPPVGRMSARPRPFANVVEDVRQAVCAVVQVRPAEAPQTGLRFATIGSGFFVSSKVFVTCHHVLMNSASPHQDGDRYDLAANLGNRGIVHTVANGVAGQNVHLFPEDDLAILIVDGNQDRAYLPLDYGNIRVGEEIGVAGYPLSRLVLVNGLIGFSGLIFRVARSVLTATYLVNVQIDGGPTLTNMPVLEVNFLFVNGNSGGPIFSAETGRVIGFVHGYQPYKLREKVETVTMIANLPAGMSNTYIDNQTALYSLGIVLSRVRDHLEQFGVSL